jgi:hypothetical protein
MARPLSPIAQAIRDSERAIKSPRLVKGQYQSKG